MITKNFDVMQRTMIFGRVWPTGISNRNNITETHYLQDDNTVARHTAGSFESYAFPTGYASRFTQSFVIQMALGEQTSYDEVIAAENYYDYKLTHQINALTASITNSPSELTMLTENGINYLRINHLFTNTTGSTKIIREIGIIAGAICDDGTSPSSPGYFLIYRKVLPQYQTLEANGTLTVDLKIPLTELAPNKPSA